MKKILTVLVLGLVTLNVMSQGTKQLTLEEAIASALENNPNLKIQKKLVDIAANNIYPGNAGLLPTISLIGDANYQNNDTDVLIRTFQENPPTFNASDNAAASTTYSAVIQADYVLLGGFSGRYRYQLLRDQKDQAYYQEQSIVNRTVIAVSDLFLEIAKLQSQEELLKKNVKIGEERLKKVEDQFQFGKVTGLAVLRAKTDLNQDRSLLDDVLVSKNNLKRDLNYILGIEAEARYRVVVSYQPPILTDSELLKDEIKAHNPDIQLQKKGVNLANSQYKISSTERLPTVSAFANYGYFNQENDVQQLAEIETLGYTVGIGFRYNLFNGGRTSKTIQNARLNREISELQELRVTDRVLADAVKERNRLVLLKDQLKRDEENIQTFRESYLRTEERFYNGKVSSLDLRDAQNALLNAEIIINNIKADIMKSSLRLEALKGSLLQR